MAGVCERCDLIAGATSNGVCGGCYTRERGTHIRDGRAWCRSCCMPGPKWRACGKVCQYCHDWGKEPNRLWWWYVACNVIRGWRDYRDESWRTGRREGDRE